MNIFSSWLVEHCLTFRQVKYTKMNGQKYHLLGLRDFTDVKPLAIDPQNAMARAARERSGSDDSQLDWRSNPSQQPSIRPTVGFYPRTQPYSDTPWDWN